jgi:glucokinase
MTTPFNPRLLADIGGTHARFAWQAGAGAPIVDEAVLPCDDHGGLEDAIAHYLASLGGRVPVEAAIGIATPITGDVVRMTNRDWGFSISALRERFGLAHLRVLNDFEALAMALPALLPTELQPVGGGQAVEGAPLAVLGAGTGLGVASLVRSASGDIAVAGEGGHVTLAAGNDEEDEVLRLLRRRFGHVSAERVLSGPGLVNLHDVARQRMGLPPLELSPAQVVSGANPGKHRPLAGDHPGVSPRQPDAPDPSCTQALDWFFGFLGSVAGNLALTVGARGGVYIGGGIVPRLLDRLQRSRFRQRFEAKGRYQGYLAAIPIWVIDTPVSPALRGAARALDAASRD